MIRLHRKGHGMTDLSKVDFHYDMQVLHDLASGKRHVDKTAKEVLEQVIDLLGTLETIYVVHKHLKAE